MKIIKVNNNKKQIINEIVQSLARGEIIVYPTETCYGVGVDATNQEAVKKILQYKTKRGDKALSVAVANKKMAEEYVHLNNTATNLYNLYLPGPVTVISRGKNKVAIGVQSPDGTLGIRIPNYKLILDAIIKFTKPITATSANASYKKTPYCIDDILQNTSKKQQKLLGLIIDAGTLPKRKPSIVTDTTVEDMKTLRSSEFDFTGFCQEDVNSEEEMDKLSQKIFNKIQGNIGKKMIIILLQGDLGTGKTFFTRSLSKYLKIKNTVSSPTFVLCREYPLAGSKGILYHMDTYRMFSAEEMNDLRCEKMFQSPNIIVIEWADKVRDYIHGFFKNAILIDMHLSHVDINKRKVFYVTKNYSE